MIRSWNTKTRRQPPAFQELSRYFDGENKRLQTTLKFMSEVDSCVMGISQKTYVGNKFITWGVFPTYGDSKLCEEVIMMKRVGLYGVMIYCTDSRVVQVTRPVVRDVAWVRSLRGISIYMTYLIFSSATVKECVVHVT